MGLYLKRLIRCSAGFVCAILVSSASGAAPPSRASADSADALNALKAMSDYVAAQKTISAAYDANIEIITVQLEKIQFNNSGEILLARPDKFKGRRVGGYADVEILYDGKTTTVLGHNTNAYAQIAGTGTIDMIFDRLREDFGMQLPGADLLLENVFQVLSDGVIEAKSIGPAVIGGVACDHFAFRNEETDWQLWIETGAEPAPRKLVIASKTVAGAPQYSLTIRDWKVGIPVSEAMFEFKTPDGARKVEFDELRDLDELPAVAVNGGSK